MHEGNFTEQIVDAILEELNKEVDLKPKKIKVSVGEMLHLVPESVQMHFEVLTKGTALEGSNLELSEIPVKVKCNQCAKEGPVEDHHMLLCGHCSSTDVALLEGEGVTIDEIEL